MNWQRAAVIMILAAGCNGGDQVKITVANADDQPILEYYLGVMAGGDPYEMGVLSEAGASYFINPARLGELRPGFDQILQPFLQGRQLNWDSLLAFAELVYDQIRLMPENVAELHDGLPSDRILEFEVHGPMTRYLRRIAVPKVALHTALNQFNGNQLRLVYPAGTSIIARHLEDSVQVETTAMFKRPDGFWEFGTYDRAGHRTAATRANPRALATPRQCVGCHLGTRQFEPEKSFPASAAAGPDGVRQWYTSARDRAVTRFFGEHERRSDMVLGLYATVYVTELLRARELGLISTEDAHRLEDLGL